jgi:hypothetical protein
VKSEQLHAPAALPSGEDESKVPSELISLLSGRVSEWLGIEVTRYRSLYKIWDKYNLADLHRVKSLVTCTDEMSVLKNKLHGFSPQANYTDRAIAACRQS